MKDYLKFRSSDSPNNIFIKYRKKTYCFKEINEIIYDRSLSLLDFGVIPNHKIAIFLSDPFEFIEAYLACYKVRVISVILNNKWKKRELENALKEVLPDFIICQYSDRDLFIRFGKPLLFIEELSKSFGSCAPIQINDRINKDNIQMDMFNYMDNNATHKKTGMYITEVLGTRKYSKQPRGCSVRRRRSRRRRASR